MFLRLFERSLQFCWRITSQYPKWTLIVWSLVVILGLAGTAKVKILLEVDELIDPTFETYASMQELRDEFGLKNNVTAFVAPNESWTKKDLCALKKSYERITARNDDIERAYSPFAVRVSELKNGDYRFPLVVDIDCLSPEGMDQRVSWSDKTYWEGTTFLTKKSELTFDWFLHDKTDPITKRRFDTALVKDLMRDFESEVRTEIPDAKIGWFGSGIYQFHMMNGYVFVGLLNLVMTALLVGFFWYFFGTWKSSLVFGFIHLQCTLVVTGIMGFMGFPVDVLSISVFMILMIASNEDFLFLSTLMQKGYSLPEAIRKELIPGFFTSLTTVIGFASLMVSDLAIISRFGLITAIGAALEWAVLFLILPQFVKLVPSIGSWVKPQALNNTVGKSWGFPKRWISYAVLLCIPVGLYGGMNLKFEDSPYQLFRDGHILRSQAVQLQQERGWNASASIIFPFTFSDQDQARILAEIQKLPLVQYVDSIPGWKKSLLDPFPDVGQYVYSPLLDTSQGFERYEGENDNKLAYVFLKNDKLSNLNAFTKSVHEICADNCRVTGSMIAYSEFGDKVARTLGESLSLSFILVALTILALSWGKLGRFEIFALMMSSFWGPCAILAMLYVFDIQMYFVGTVFASILTGFAGDNQIQYIFFKDKEGDGGIDLWQTAASRVCLLLIFFPLVFLLAPFAPLQFLGAIFAIGSLFLAFGDIFLLRGLLGK